MDAYQKAHKALCVYGDMKRAKVKGGEPTQAWLAHVTAGLAHLSNEELLTVRCLYIEQMTQEEAAETMECDPRTIARRKQRAVEWLALFLYPDEYLQDKIMQGDVDY